MKKERGKDEVIVTMINGAYPWLYVTQILIKGKTKS
jgi:hypothetical protein